MVLVYYNIKEAIPVNTSGGNHLELLKYGSKWPANGY